MRIVIDTNILFSSFLFKGSKYRDLIFDESHKFYSPNFVFLEIFRHKEKILKYTKASEDDVYGFLSSLLKRINFVNEELISEDNYKKAASLCKNIDENDTPFVALALELNAYLLTGDEKLKKGLKEKGFTNFFEI